MLNINKNVNLKGFNNAVLGFKDAENVQPYPDAIKLKLTTVQVDVVSLSNKKREFQGTIDKLIQKANLPEKPGFGIPVIFENSHDKLASKIKKEFKKAENMDGSDKYSAICSSLNENLSSRQINDVLESMYRKNFKSIFYNDYSDCFDIGAKKEAYLQRKLMAEFVDVDSPLFS